jgi:hypothetical protein
MVFSQKGQTSTLSMPTLARAETSRVKESESSIVYDTGAVVAPKIVRKCYKITLELTRGLSWGFFENKIGVANNFAVFSS